MIMRNLLVALMLGVGLTTQAQRVAINDVQALGFMPEFGAMGPTGVNLVTKVKLTYDHVSQDQAGCCILVNNGKLPQIETAIELLQCAPAYCFGSEDLEAASVQKNVELEVSLPIEDKKLNGKEEILHAQVFVIYDEENPKLLAKSGIIDINPKKLKSLQEEVDYEQQEEDMKRHLIGGILGEIADNPMSIDDNGYKICTACHGEGKTKSVSYKASWEADVDRVEVTTVSTCEYCGGTGKVKATEDDYEMNRAAKKARQAGGVDNDALYDFFTNNRTSSQGKTKKSANKSTGKGSKTKKQNNAMDLNKLLDDFFGF